MNKDIVSLVCKEYKRGETRIYNRMENWLLATLIIIVSWLALGFGNYIVFNMESDIASFGDAIALSYIVLGMPSAVLYSWLENQRPSGFLTTLILIADFFIVSYLVTGKWVVGKWIGHGRDPGYYPPETLPPLLLIWMLYVIATFAFTWESDVEYVDLYYLFIFLLAFCRFLVHIVMFMLFEDKQ